MKKWNNYLKKLFLQLERMHRMHIKKELYASEVIENVIRELSIKYSNKQIIFAGGVSVLALADPDWHRIDKAYMRYRVIRIFQFNGKYWVLGLGEAYGGHLARPYRNDIIATQMLPEEISDNEKITDKIQMGMGFNNSLLVARYGVISVIARKDCFCGSAYDDLEKTILEFKIEDPETNDEHVFVNSTLYKAELVEALAELIPQILAKS